MTAPPRPWRCFLSFNTDPLKLTARTERIHNKYSSDFLRDIIEFLKRKCTATQNGLMNVLGL